MLARSTRLALLALTGALVLLPLAWRTPGLPASLKADEPAYLLMAQSLAYDFDLRCETKDLARLLAEFPRGDVRNLILMTDDGWRTVWFGKPFTYSLLSAPAARFFGANGLIAVNMALLALMIWQGTRYLSRFNPEGLALLFATGFFLLSVGAAYAFWLHPEVFNMAAVSSCLYLGFAPASETRPAAGKLARLCHALRSADARLAWSGAAISLAAYNKPVYAALGLPVLVLLTQARRWKSALAWCSGALAAMALLCALSIAWTGHPSAYLGVERAGLSVVSADAMPVEPVPQVAGAERSQANSWWWLFRLPETSWRRLTEDLGYFFWGRHTGLFPYLPFSLVALLLFAFTRGRSAERWAILAALAIVALFFLLLIPFNWHGGGGFVGNRYFVAVYPAFLFLVTRLSPAGLVPLGWAAGGLLVGPLLLTALGAPVVHPTLQAHTRNFPFDRLPLELSLLDTVPGYRGTVAGEVWFLGRKDVFLPAGSELFVGPEVPVEIWAMSDRPLSSAVFDVAPARAGSHVRVAMGGTTAELDFTASSAPQRLAIDLREPTKLRDKDGALVWSYRLVVSADRGVLADIGGGDDHEFLHGATLLYLGTRAEVDADLYAVAWREVGPLADPVAAGRPFALPVRLANASTERWRAAGGGSVVAAYHWRRLDDGAVVVADGRRSPLPHDLAPGQEAAFTLTVDAPSSPGRYRLELDLLRERITWFADRRRENLYRLEVEVVAGD